VWVEHWPEFIDPVFAKTSSLSVIETAFWACFHENWVFKFKHWCETSRSIVGGMKEGCMGGALAYKKYTNCGRVKHVWLEHWCATSR
jgi:hypothetical protein